MIKLIVAFLPVVNVPAVVVHVVGFLGLIFFNPLTNLLLSRVVEAPVSKRAFKVEGLSPVFNLMNTIGLSLSVIFFNLGLPTRRFLREKFCSLFLVSKLLVKLKTSCFSRHIFQSDSELLLSDFSDLDLVLPGPLY